MVEIPLQAIPSQELQVILDDQQCTISLYWRTDHLFLDLIVGTEAVAQGMICNNKASVIPFKSLNFKGSLHFYDMLGETVPNWQGLGDRYVFLYLSESDTVPTALSF